MCCTFEDMGVTYIIVIRTYSLETRAVLTEIFMLY